MSTNPNNPNNPFPVILFNEAEAKEWISDVLVASVNEGGMKSIIKGLVIQRGYNYVEQMLELATMELMADGELP